MWAGCEGIFANSDSGLRQRVCNCLLPFAFIPYGAAPRVVEGGEKKKGGGVGKE